MKQVYVCGVCGKDTCFLGAKACLQNQGRGRPLIPYIERLEKRIDELEETVKNMNQALEGVYFR